MKFIVTDNTIILRDSTFYYEVYKPLSVTRIIRVLEFEPTDGLVEIMTDVGELLINWDTGLNEGVSFSEMHIFEYCTILREQKEGIALHIMMDDISMDSEVMGDVIKIRVTDMRNKHNRAVFILKDDTLILQNSTFKPESVRKWQMLYFLEVNKNLFKKG